MSALKYSYHEERGEFHGYVEDEMGNVIYEMHYPEFYEDDETGELIESSTIFEDGFMQDADDIEGLRKYLLSMRLINEDDEVIHESEYKSTYNDGGLTSGAYGHGTTLLEEGGELELPFKKTIQLGKVAYYGDKKANAVELKVELRKIPDDKINWDTLKRIRDGVEFSMSGGIWNSKHTDYITGGQNLEEIAKFFPANKDLQELIEYWRKYHLNDMKAGTIRQTEAIEEWQKMGNRYDYTQASEYLKSIDLYQDDWYKYGHGWLVRPIPESDLNRIFTLINKLANQKLEEGGEMDIEREDAEDDDNKHLEEVSDDTGIPVDVLRSYADELGMDYSEVTSNIPYIGSFGTQEDFAEYLVDNHLIGDLSYYLKMTDTDKRIIANDEAEARLDGMDDEDIAEAAGMSDEYEKLKEYLDRHEELAEQIESLEDEIADMKDSFDTDDATEEDIEKFDSELKEKEDELDKLADENEPLENLEFDSLEDFIDSIKDDALSNISDEIEERLDNDAVGYFKELGYNTQDLANHSFFYIDYEAIAEDYESDFVYTQGDDGDYYIFNNYADGGAIPEGYHQMPDGTIMPDSAHLEHGGDVAESNLHMLINQAEQFEHHAKELQEALSKNPRVDAWVVAKAERAATDLSDITHYLEGENNIHTDGDGEDVIKMDVPLFIRSQEYAREDAKSDADLHEFTDNAIDLSQSGETLEMDDYKNLVPNHMAKGGVIASSSSKEGIQKLISEYYYGSKITLNKVGDAYEVSNAKGRVKGVKVVEKNGRYQFVNDIKMMARGGVNFGASFDKLKKDVLDEANAEKLLMLPKGILEEINESIDMGYDTLVEGKISPTRKGVMLIDKDYNVRGTYDLGLKSVIENILSKRKGSYAKGGKVSSFFSKAKEKYVQAKDYTKKQIKDKKKQIALEVIDSTKDKVSGNKQKMLLKSVEQIVEDNYARGGELKEVQRNKFEYKGHLITINKRGVKKYTYQIDYYWWSPVYESRQKALEEAMQHINEGNLKMAKGGGLPSIDEIREKGKWLGDYMIDESYDVTYAGNQENYEYNGKTYFITTWNDNAQKHDDGDETLEKDYTYYNASDSYAKGGGINKRGYVRAYYNDTISGGDNGHQVNLMFFRNKEDDDYFDEEFTTTNSPKEAEALAEKINKYGISGFSPKGKYSWEDKYAKGGGIEKKEYLDEYLKKIGVDKNELPARALRYHTKMANKKYENERLNDLPYKKYLVTYKIPFGAILSKVVDARTHNEAKINFRKEHGGKDVQGNVNKILKVSLTKVKKEDGGEMARGGETNKYEIYHETLSSALNEVENWAKKNGVEIRGDYFPDVKIGGINYGETKRFSIPIIKEGKKDYAKIMIQVYRMDSGRYELNMYPTYAKGGATFDDKVKAISSSLTGKEVPKRLRKDYGKKYNKKEALEAARRIAGSMRAKEMKKGKK